MDKKLTDNEIKKALECCVKETHTCLECPYTEFGQCEFLVMKDALDLINRLEAENERLTKCRKEEVEKLMSAIDKVITEAKSEARKEFAERLCEDRVSNDNVVIAAKCLLEEMEEDNQ